MLAKAELHVHLEGTIKPSLVKQLNRRHKLGPIPETLFDENDGYNWDDFLHFLKVYDVASDVIRTAEDYYDTTFEYLKQSAEQGCIYVEMMASPEHAARYGLSYSDLTLGIAHAIDDARDQFQIEGRIITTCVRHYGVDACLRVAENAAKYPHPYVVGFGMGGDEAGYPPKQFARAFEIARDVGLGCTAHAGEMVGPEGVKEAIDNLHITRIGHGVRSIESPELIQEIIDKEITLECSPGSNIVLRVYPNYDEHPLRKLYDQGVKVTLNSDDPPFFYTNIAQEYETAKTHFKFTDSELIQLTTVAIENSFADPDTKQALLGRIAQSNDQ